MYTVVTMDEVKTWLNLSGTGMDTFVRALTRAITAVIEGYTGKTFITRQYTEYHDSRQLRQMIFLKNYPVYDAANKLSIWHDSDRSFTSSTLVSSADYVVYEEEGVVKLTDSFWATLRDVDRNIKVQYWAGYSRFELVDEQNNYIDVDEGSGAVSVKLTVGEYTAEDLATELQTKLNASALTGTYTVTYDHETQKFTIATTVSAAINFASGLKQCNDVLGFNATDRSTATSHTSDFGVTGLPEDITLAARKLVMRYFEQSGQGKSTQEVLRETIEQGGTREWLKDELHSDVKMMLEIYRRPYL